MGQWAKSKFVQRWAISHGALGGDQDRCAISCMGCRVNSNPARDQYGKLCVG
jgi:hypothetical protein